MTQILTCDQACYTEQTESQGDSTNFQIEYWRHNPKAYKVSL